MSKLSVLAFKRWGTVVHDFRDDKTVHALLEKAFDMEPKRAMKFLREKFPKVTWKWDDLDATAHQTAFTVAKVMKADLLAAIHEALLESMSNEDSKGESFATFKKKLMPILIEAGWVGRGKETNPETGKEEVVKRATTNRLKIIMETNLQSAFMNGRWQQILQSAKTRPYVRYYNPDPKTQVCIDMNNKVMRIDDPNVRITPFHYRCKTSMTSASQSQVERRNLEIVDGKDIAGIHESFDTAPLTPFQPDTNKYPEAIAAELKKAMATVQKIEKLQAKAEGKK